MTTLTFHAKNLIPGLSTAQAMETESLLSFHNNLRMNHVICWIIHNPSMVKSHLWTLHTMERRVDKDACGQSQRCMRFDICGSQDGALHDTIDMRPLGVRFHFHRYLSIPAWYHERVCWLPWSLPCSINFASQVLKVRRQLRTQFAGLECGQDVDGQPILFVKANLLRGIQTLCYLEIPAGVDLWIWPNVKLICRKFVDERTLS